MSTTTKDALWDHLISPRAKEILAKLETFIREDCIPGSFEYEKFLHNSRGHDSWAVPPVIEKLKAKAKSLGLWNLFLPKSYPEGAGLTNLEYALMAELMGRCYISSEACNCSAPDTGNMEVLAKYGNREQKEKWLKPLLNGDIRSAFLMTEPRVASSDASNICTIARRDGDHFVINGRKWWSSGACDPRCKITVCMVKIEGYQNRPRHLQQSMILIPTDAPGFKIVRHLSVFGYNDAPHGHAEIQLKDVRVPISNLILGDGKGFEISQGRLGPGRIHHCMRSIGMAEEALDAIIARAHKRKTFGKNLARHGTIRHDIAESRIEIDQARLLVLQAAHAIDCRGGKLSRKEVTMIKVGIPNMACRVLDRAIQCHGGAGVSQDFFLARAYAGMRTLRIADGPDEVHRMVIARLELMREPLFEAHHDHDPEVYHSDEHVHKLQVDYSSGNSASHLAHAKL